jgi:transcriptional regulator with XRE-family HTH domain
MNSKQEQMWENLRDKDFREQFIDEHINVGIAFQIRSLRNRQNLKQSELAQLLGVKQPLVSSWENPNYGKYTLNTLKDLAKAFDVGLLVRFVPSSTLIDWTVGLTSAVIAPPSFNEEEKLRAASPGVIKAVF